MADRHVLNLGLGKTHKTIGIYAMLLQNLAALGETITVFWAVDSALNLSLNVVLAWVRATAYSVSFLSE